MCVRVCVCVGLVPAHAALPGASAAGGGRRGLVGPAIVRPFQVPYHLRHKTRTLLLYVKGKTSHVLDRL